MTRLNDLTGLRYGKLMVIARGSNSNTGQVQWRCVCDCGGLTLVRATCLHRDETTSCGCVKRTACITHGGYKTPEYRVWAAMLGRCTNPKHQGYPDYGGRGITVCEAWRNGFQAFWNDMGPRPSVKHSIDRIDNDHGYEPSNCRWATRSQQGCNTREPSHKRTPSGHVGVMWDKRSGKWCAKIVWQSKQYHLGFFHAKADAVTARLHAETRFGVRPALHVNE